MELLELLKIQLREQALSSSNLLGYRVEPPVSRQSNPLGEGERERLA